MSTEVLKDSLHFLMMGYAPINLLKAYFENESEIEEKRCYLEKILHEKFASNEIFLKNGHLKIMIKDILHDARQNFKSSEESTYRLDAFRWILGDEFFNTILYPILESRYGGRIREVVGLANFFEKKLNNKTYGIDNRYPSV